MKNLFYLCFHISLLCFIVVALPVTQKEKKEKPEEKNDEVINLEYERYLREVVEALESDPDFRKKLDKANEVDIRSGKIAQELEYVSHHVRSKLDELKRQEIARLQALASKQYELSNDIDRDHMKIPEHLDHANVHTFEIDDLRKLIHKTSEDLLAADKERREEFKQYELQKEYEKQEKLKQLDEENRKKLEEEMRKQKEKHNQHEKVHHPGNKAQLEDVWEKSDHMEGQQFDPKAFFMIHDVDGNGVWDETELKALFVRELNKVFQSGAPDSDLRERAEEMERMREHVFQESDTNHDGLISFQEFIDQTKREEFQRDPNWETVDNIPQFTREEYLEFERRRQEEVQRLIAKGVLPQHPNIPQGYYPHGINPQEHGMNPPPDPRYHPQQFQPPQYQEHQYQQQPPQQYQQAQYQQPQQVHQPYNTQRQPQVQQQHPTQFQQQNTFQSNPQYQQPAVGAQPPQYIPVNNQNVNNVPHQQQPQPQQQPPPQQQQQPLPQAPVPQNNLNEQQKAQVNSNQIYEQVQQQNANNNNGNNPVNANNVPPGTANQANSNNIPNTANNKV